MPSGYKLAVEIRNKQWLNDRLADLLREHKVALVLQDRNGCRCRTNSQKRLTQSRRTGRIYAGSETGNQSSKLRRRGIELSLTAHISYPAGSITASRFKDVESRFLLMLTIISAGTLPQPFDSSANCGARRDCLRYPNHEGFKGKLRCRFLMSRFDVGEANTPLGYVPTMNKLLIPGV